LRSILAEAGMLHGDALQLSGNQRFELGGLLHVHYRLAVLVADGRCDQLGAVAFTPQLAELRIRQLAHVELRFGSIGQGNGVGMHVLGREHAQVGERLQDAQGLLRLGLGGVVGLAHWPFP